MIDSLLLLILFPFKLTQLSYLIEIILTVGFTFLLQYNYNSFNCHSNDFLCHRLIIYFQTTLIYILISIQTQLNITQYSKLEYRDGAWIFLWLFSKLHFYLLFLNLSFFASLKPPFVSFPFFIHLFPHLLTLL